MKVRDIHWIYKWNAVCRDGSKAMVGIVAGDVTQMKIDEKL